MQKFDVASNTRSHEVCLVRVNIMRKILTTSFVLLHCIDIDLIVEKFEGSSIVSKSVVDRR